MKIGNLELENNMVLAPMAGITDKAYRIICKEMGAGLVVSEMVSSKGLYYEDKKTESLTDVGPKERPVALQIFGSDPYIMGKVIEKYINPRKDIGIIDINMGCPAPKIVKNGDGAALLKNPLLIRKILKEIVKVSNKPVTLKIRMGWDHNNINGIKVGKIAEEEGISALTIHPRTRDMFYSGKADWDFIKRMKKSIDIPVIGNGDIFGPIDAINMMEFTGCDGVAIGRGAIGNPWIFNRIKLVIEGKEDIKLSYKEIINMAIRHLELLCSIKGEKVGVKEMRKHISWYLKGIKNSNRVKNQINTVDNKEKMKEILFDYLLELDAIIIN
ncbi:putative tRNA-dihydrouridine synthase 1 [[Clostridium] ultunense Esp]|uniref:tRNA-dihydrouridine synthase n=1 Tax=[Clostridium] ultunense Esp TaxID=1288971 RepID=M1Z9I0_9FIRM|nr:tRNA dihydrouridine synthase DusB [Schnuerera ultunensis]CCQ94801.1 putative tRNA-dihydrouridine synthase 1 [[Clostridium] ultunense Esp]SHD78364.1 tRNA-dihydrouridine synthase B [[Clostridium] ultunense Esp]